MKNTKTKSNPKQKAIKELASFFEEDFNKQLPISVQPDGTIVYKGYFVKQLKTGNWGLFNLHNKSMIDQFYLKSCALMAAKAYNNVRLENFFEIKHLDNRYWANYCDLQVYKNNIKIAKDFDRYLVLLNKLENSEQLTNFYKTEISTKFKWTFV